MLNWHSTFLHELPLGAMLVGFIPLISVNWLFQLKNISGRDEDNCLVQMSLEIDLEKVIVTVKWSCNMVEKGGGSIAIISTQLGNSPPM